jgi:hypothetical protein
MGSIRATNSQPGSSRAQSVRASSVKVTSIKASSEKRATLDEIEIKGSTKADRSDRGSVSSGIRNGKVQ